MTESTLAGASIPSLHARPSRRRFVAGAAMAAPLLAAPALVGAQGATVLKMQGVWTPGDVLDAFARDYVAMVNEMGGGRLRIEYTHQGVPPPQVMEAVHRGDLDAAHHATTFSAARHKAASLFVISPGLGLSPSQCLGWMHRGGGQALYDELLQQVLKLNVVSHLAFAMPAQPLGWFRQPLKGAEDFKGLKYRAFGLVADLFKAMGCEVVQVPPPEIMPALQSGRIQALEFNNPSSDAKFGFQKEAKYYYLASYHQSAECTEVVFNKARYDSLAPEQRAILRHAAKACAADAEWKAMDVYSKALDKLVRDDGVKVLPTPKDVLKAQLKAWRGVTAELEKDPFTKRVIDSQRRWARQIGPLAFGSDPDYRAAWEDAFGALGT